MPACNINATSLCGAAAPFKQDSKIGIVNVSHDGPLSMDISLEMTQCKISNHLRVVDGVDALVAEVLSLANCSDNQKFVIDIVAHSTSLDQVLVFDGWELRSGEGVKQLFGSMQSAFSRIYAIRLIGCSTAVTEEGKAALAEIEKVVDGDILVFGTDVDVNVNSFSSSQYDEVYLGRSWGSRSVRPSVPDLAAIPLVGSPLKRLQGRTVARPVRAVIAEVWGVLRRALADGYAATSPGLLLEPLWTGEIPLKSDHGQEQRVRVDVLYDWKYLRVWPPDGEDGVIFEIDSRRELERSLSSLRAKHVGPARRISP